MDLEAITSSDKTLAAVDAVVEGEQADAGRGHLGASQIGRDCVRELWYSFRDFTPVHFPTKTLYMFADGHLSESVMVERLQKVIDLEPVDPVTGKQWRFSDHDGHFGGSLDGIIRGGLVEAPSKPHVWEAKSLGDSTWKKLNKLKAELPEKEVLKAFSLTYYAQAQIYMHYMKMDRHYLTASTAGAREWTSVRTDYCKEDAEFYINRAHRIITSDTPPPRIGRDQTDFKCKWCDHSAVCWEGAAPRINCRSCKHSYAGADNTWVCDKFTKVLSREDQLAACPEHEYISNV